MSNLPLVIIFLASSLLALCNSMSFRPFHTSSTSATGCLNISGPSKYIYPKDYGVHLDHEGELWWYLGHLWSYPLGYRFGIELGVFRVDALNQCQSLENSLFNTDFCISDIKNNQFYHTNIQDLGSTISINSDPSQAIVIKAPSWSIVQLTPPTYNTFVITATNSLPGSELLSMNLTCQLVFPGNVPMAKDGYERDSPDSGTIHLEQPYLNTIGTLTVNGTQFDVHGLFFLQHLWWQYSKIHYAQGWDWDYAQLDNGYFLSLTHFWTNGTYLMDVSYLNLVFPNGDNIYTQNYSTVRTRPWKSPNSGYIYFIDSQLTVPEWNIVINFSTLIEDNEIMISGAPQYYEGAAAVTGYFGDTYVTGVGYTEIMLHA